MSRCHLWYLVNFEHNIVQTCKLGVSSCHISPLFLRLLTAIRPLTTALNTGSPTARIHPVQRLALLMFGHRRRLVRSVYA